MPASLVAPVTLEGSFVRLEPLSMAHVPGLVTAAAEDRSNYQWTWVPDGRLAMQQWAVNLLAGLQAGTDLPLATVEKRSGRIIGATRFMHIEYWPWPSDNPNQRGEDRPDTVEIGGTWLAASAQHTAVNTEAKLLMITHAFEVWRVHSVTWRTDARNLRSRAAIERLGAHLDGTLRACQPASDGTVRDTVVYSLIESEYPAARAALEARLDR